MKSGKHTRRTGEEGESSKLLHQKRKHKDLSLGHGEEGESSKLLHQKRKHKDLSLGHGEEGESSKLLHQKRKHKDLSLGLASAGHKKPVPTRNARIKGKRVVKDISSDSESESTLVFKKRRTRTKVTQSSDSKSASEGNSSGCKKGTINDLLDELTDNDSEADMKRIIKPTNCFGNVRVNRSTTYYRSNLKTSIREIKALCFNESHLREIKRTPFWLMFNAIYRLGDDQLRRKCHKNEDDIRQIMLAFDDSSGSFMIGGELIPLVNRDVQLIFGISGGSETIQLKVTEYDMPPWISRCFGEDINNSNGHFVLYKNYIYEKLKQTLSRDDEDSIRDVARLTHCYLMAAVLTPNQNAAITWHLAWYVERFDDIGRYDWCTFIADMLRNQIMSSRNLKTGGCAIILPFWLCEHTRLVEPKNKVAFPRFLKWDLNDLHKKLSRIKLSRLEPEYIRKLVLKPTSIEKDKFRSLLKFCELERQRQRNTAISEDEDSVYDRADRAHSVSSDEDDVEATSNLGICGDLKPVKEASLSNKEKNEDIASTSKKEARNFMIDTPLIVRENIPSSSKSLDVPVLVDTPLVKSDDMALSLNMSQLAKPPPKVNDVIQCVAGQLKDSDADFVADVVDGMGVRADLGKLYKGNDGVDTQLEQSVSLIVEKASAVKRYLIGSISDKRKLSSEVEQLRQEKEVEREHFEAEMKKKDDCIAQLRAENEDLRSRLKTMTVPMPTQFCENHDNLALLGTLEQLHVAKIQNEELLKADTDLMDTNKMYEAADNQHAKLIVNKSKKLQDDLQELGGKIKHHEDNVSFLKSQKNKLDSSILDMQIAIGKYHTTSPSEEENDDPAHVDANEETIQNVLKFKNSAVALACMMTTEAQVSDHFFIKDIVGIVATLGKVDDANLSRLLSKYLGLETMLTVVCKSYEGVKSMESYSRDGSIDKSFGIHAFAASVGSPLDGTFNVICIERLRPYTGELVADDPQRRLNLLNPRFENGETPPGFLGFAVNMIMIDNTNLYSASESGHSLRDTLFYNLFSTLQVYKTREDMLKAIPLISSGAISLDGGLIRSPGEYVLGHNQEDIDVKFPCNPKKCCLPADYYYIENRLKKANWKKDRAIEDLGREQQLLDHAMFRYETKKEEYVQFLAESSSYATQGEAITRPLLLRK